MTDFFATVRSGGVLCVNSLIFTDDAATGDLKTDSLDFRRAGFFHSGFADEVVFFHLDCEVEPGFQRSYIVVHFMSVERHGCFHTKGVSSTQSARDQAVVPACFQKQIPEFFRLVSRCVKLYTVFSRVSRLGNDARDPADFPVEYCVVVFRRNLVFRRKSAKDLHCFRSLQSQLRILVGHVCEGSSRELVIQHPLEIFIFVGSVDYDEVVVICLFIYDQVIYCTAVLVAHRAVACLSVNHICKVVGQQMLQVFEGFFSFAEDLAHVRNVE